MSIRPVVPALNLIEMSRAQLQALMEDLGQPSFRTEQIYRWVFSRGARSFDEMTNLPKSLREALIERGVTIGRLEVETVQVSSDGTRKLGLRMYDGSVVETVLIPMGEGQFSQCLSSQVGCALGCKFCYTATLGLFRNLTPGEIVDQIIVGRAQLPEGARLTHLVFMGMGEPMHNLDGVLASFEHICDPAGLAFSQRRITVSTSGLVPGIERLGRSASVNLALSLNATTDEVRDRIMPINKRWPIARLLEALRNYPLAARRKITVEYVLLGGVNDTEEDARRLGHLLRGMQVRINLIPWNPFTGPGFERPAPGVVERFHEILDRQGFTVTVRVTKGLDIDAACGQLGERPTA